MPESFGRDTRPTISLGHQAEAEWHRLRQQLDLASGFWLGFLFSPSGAVTRVFRQRTETILRSRALTLQSLEPETPEELEALLPRLFEPHSNTGCVWLEAPRIDSPGTDPNASGSWTHAWSQLLLRLNERRDRLRRTLDCGLLLAAHSRIKPQVRDAAPDLWSVRSIVLEPIPGPLDRPIIFEPDRPRRRLEVERQPDDRPSMVSEASSDLAPEASEIHEAGAIGHETDSENPASLSARLLRRASAELQNNRPRDAIDDAVRAIEILDSLQPAEGPDRANAYALLAEAELADGDPGSAEGHLRQALELLEDPLDRRALKWLDSLDGIARNQGDLNTSEAVCREWVRRSRARLESDPSSQQALRDLSVSLSKLGDAQRDQGELQQATAAFQESLQIRRRLLGTYGESPQTLRDLAVCLYNLSRVYRVDDSATRAREALAEAADLEKRRAARYGIRSGEPSGLLIVLRALASVLQESEGAGAARPILDEIEVLEQATPARQD